MTDTFEAALVRAGQLQKATRQDGSTSSYMYITVVRNYQKFNRQTQTWEEQGSIFQECSLNGKSAEENYMEQRKELKEKIDKYMEDNKKALKKQIEAIAEEVKKEVCQAIQE